MFAAETKVPVERTKVELDQLLQKHGATQRIMGTDDGRGLGIVGFTLGGRQVRLRIPLPDREKYKSTQKFEQATRARWRAALLVTKAKLEYIAMQMSTVDKEFLAQISLPDGGTVLEFLQAGLDEAYTNGHMPPLLGMGEKS
jgi:hypothetical protein